MPDERIRLLALDGGGVRGLSSLMILQRLMETVNPESPPRPCEYFEMIGGTSTGGLIAITLGRLRMTVHECINAYTSISDKVFQKKAHRVNLRGKLQGRFDTAELERAVKKILVERGLDQDVLFRDTDTDTSCKTFVCATSKETAGTVCLTSYRSPRGSPDLLSSTKVWQACRATSAATTFFDPIAIGSYDEEFVDGAVGENNPVYSLWNQAQDIWGAGQMQRNLQCLVSIGTGVPAVNPVRDDALGIWTTLKDLATETERTAERFHQDKSSLDDEGRYYRFNVSHGLEEIGLEESKKKREIAAATGRYTASQAVFKQLQACANTLALRQYAGPYRTAFALQGVPVSKNSVERPSDSAELEQHLLPRTRSRDRQIRWESEVVQSQPVSKLLQDCLKSLAFPLMENRSHDIDRAVTGTCEWLLRHEKYRSWASSDRGLLWIKGKPGSGKSTLLKHALDKRGCVPGASDSDLVLSFFFQRTPQGFFRSLLHQVLRQVPAALPELVDTFEQKCNGSGEPGEKWQWHPKELRCFFESSLPNVLKGHSVWLYVDALDECGQKDAADLFRWFKSLLRAPSPTDSQFHICVTCRHYPILDPYCGFEICLEDQNTEDISTYVQARLSESPDLIGSTVPALITERARGVFMWARLAVNIALDLDHQGYGLRKIEAEIYSVPPELDTLYRELIRSMGSDSLKLTQWICFATRPLLIDELRWAMLIEARCPHRSIRACQSAADYISDNDKMKRQIQTLSCGLAEVIPTSNGQVVQFIHQSVQDFFVEKGLSALDSSSNSADAAIAYAHFRLSRICIRYLAMEEISQSIRHETGGTISDFPFLLYATTSWMAHVKQSDSRSVPQDDLLEYFAWPSDDLIGLWARVYEIMDKYSPDCPPQGTTLIHVASRYQVIGLLRAILRKTDQMSTDIDTKDSQGKTPLSIAAKKGHEAIVKLLLNTGKVDIDSKDYKGQTPLSSAAAGGHAAVVKLLLETGKVDINLKGDSDRTLLSLAAEEGYEAIVKLFLETGKVDINSKSSCGRTPLSFAAEEGHEAVVKLLLETGKVDINSKGDSDSTPLSFAATGGHAAVVKLLLNTCKVDIDSKGGWGQTPLSFAAEEGYKAVVKLLLDTGKVDIDSKNSWGQTPLSFAAEKGHESVVKLLLNTGKVDIDSKSSWNRTPLSFAAAGGHAAVVKLLLNTCKVDIDSKDYRGQTPLMLAAGSRHEAVVKLLLDTGKVDIDSKDSKGWTWVGCTAENWHETDAKREKMIWEMRNVSGEMQKISAELQKNFRKMHKTTGRAIKRIR